jgi:polysaccharide transporter, PST family
VLSRIVKHVAFRNVVLLYVVQFSSYIMPLITLPYLSRVLSPEKFGLIAYAQSFMWYFVTLTEYSFNLTATREVAIHRENSEEVSNIFSAVMASKLFLTLLGLAILMGTVFAVPKLRVNWPLFLVSFLTVTGNLFFPLWLFQGLQRLEQVAIRDFLAKLLGIVALFALVHNDGDYVLAASVQAGSVAVAGLAGLASVPFLSPVRWRMPRYQNVRAALVSGWPLFLSLAATSFAAVTNVVILGFLSSPAEVGYYSGAQRIIAALKTLVGPLVTAVYPMVSVKAGRSEREAVGFIEKYALLFSGPFLLIGIVLLIAGPWMIRLVLGPRYGPSMVVMQVMALSPFMLALSHVYSTYYMLACGYDKAWMRIMLIAVGINFLFLFPLLYLMRGALALAVTGVVTDVAAVVLYWRFYMKHAPRGKAAIANYANSGGQS